MTTLQELMPENPEFTLESTKKTYRLRIPNQEDKVRLKQICGSDERALEIFNKLEWSEIAKLVYRLLEDKTDFLAKEVEEIDDEGVKRKYLITGPVLLLRAVKTRGEAIGMLQAFNAAAMASEPLFKDFIDAEVKKNLSAQQIGENFSKSLQASGDTPPESSGPSQAAS